MTEKKLTGYPSTDRPQTKFYKAVPFREIKTEQTIYEMVFNSNDDNMSAPAIEYMGVTWSFEKLKSKVDQASDAFVKAGLQLGDTVLLGVSNCPEAITTLLALNKIGVVSRWFDVRASEKDIEHYANDSNCRHIIAFDMLLPKIQKVINNTKLEKVLVIYPTDSLSVVMQTVYSLKANRLPKDSRYIRFKHFVKNGDSKSNISCVPFDKKRPSIMIQSSGTTGKPKIIVHSDFSATTCVQKLTYSDLPMSAGKSVLVYLPPWIAYALGNAILYSLTLGAKAILSPTFDPKDFSKYIGKFTMCFTAPFCYRYIRDNYSSLTKKQIEQLSKIECLVSGGDKISEEENAELEKLFGTVIVNGYGNNEGWGCLTVNPTKSNKYGTVGIPKYGETIIAYDADTGKELPFGESGEICSLTDTMFLYYDGNPTETSAVKQLHPDGKTWLHTGDLGFVDEDGFITLNGRARRVIVRQAFKISAYTIEDKITEHPDVKECVAVEVKDPVEEHVPMVYIILKSDDINIETAKQSIYQKCCSELKEYEIPKYFRIVKELPYTQNGKYDFRLLEKLGNGFVEKSESIE